MLRRLFVSIGFPWAVRSLSFLILAGLVVCCATMRLRPHQRRRGPLFELRQFQDGAYTSFVVGMSKQLPLLSVGTTLTCHQKHSLP